MTFIIDGVTSSVPRIKSGEFRVLANTGVVSKEPKRAGPLIKKAGIRLD